MSQLNEFEIDFDEINTDKKQPTESIKVNVVKLDHDACNNEKNNDPNIKNVIIDNVGVQKSQSLQNTNNLEEINLNCDNNLKSIDVNNLSQSNENDNKEFKEINLDELSLPNNNLVNELNDKLENLDDMHSINLDDLEINEPIKLDTNVSDGDKLKNIDLSDISLDNESLQSIDFDETFNNKNNPDNNIDNDLNELDSLFSLKDEENKSLEKVLVDSNNEDMNLDNKSLEYISNDMSGGGEDYDYDSDESNDSNESIDNEEFNQILKGGSKKYKLPINFDKIDGIYTKTKEYLENRNSKEYIEYLEALETYYQEQKQKKNLEKFSYYVDENGNYIKTQDKKNILKIIPPKYEKTSNIIEYLHNNLELLESKIKVLRNKTILEPNKENKDEFESMKTEYIKIVNQYNIFKDYNSIINNIKNNLNAIKVLAAQKFNLRKELKSLFIEIKELSQDKNKNKSILNKKIKDYLNKNKVNDIDLKIKDIKNLQTIDYVILEKPKIILEGKTNKLVKKTGKKVLKSGKKVLKSGKKVLKSTKKKKVINTNSNKKGKAKGKEEEKIEETIKEDNNEDNNEEEVKEEQNNLEEVKAEEKKEIFDDNDKNQNKLEEIKPEELNLEELNLEEFKLDESEEKQSGGSVKKDDKLDNLLEAEELDLSDDLESIEPEYFESKPKKKGQEKIQNQYYQKKFKTMKI